MTTTETQTDRSSYCRNRKHARCTTAECACTCHGTRTQPDAGGTSWTDDQGMTYAEVTVNTQEATPVAPSPDASTDEEATEVARNQREQTMWRQRRHARVLLDGGHALNGTMPAGGAIEAMMAVEETMTALHALQVMKLAVEAAEWGYVRALREEGASWSTVARQLGVSRQGATQRFGSVDHLRGR